MTTSQAGEDSIINFILEMPGTTLYLLIIRLLKEDTK